MMTYLLEISGRPEGQGVSPRGLKVTTISALMAEVVKGRENLPHLAIQGNYRAVTSQEMDNAHSSNVDQRQLFVAKFAQKRFSGK